MKEMKGSLPLSTPPRGSHHSTMTSDNAFAKRMKYQSIGLLQCLFYNYYFKHKQ
jgi:hypothetical protein